MSWCGIMLIVPWYWPYCRCLQTSFTTRINTTTTNTNIGRWMASVNDGYYGWAFFVLRLFSSFTDTLFSLKIWPAEFRNLVLWRKTSGGDWVFSRAWAGSITWSTSQVCNRKELLVVDSTWLTIVGWLSSVNYELTRTVLSFPFFRASYHSFPTSFAWRFQTRVAGEEGQEAWGSLRSWSDASRKTGKDKCLTTDVVTALWLKTVNLSRKGCAIRVFLVFSLHIRPLLNLSYCFEDCLSVSNPQ